MNKRKHAYRLAFFGDAFCRRTRPHSPVRSFVDIVTQHYGRDVELVAEGEAGGTDMKQLLRTVTHSWLTTPWDLAWLFYEPMRPLDADSRLYLAQQQRLIDWQSQHAEAKIIHCYQPSSPHVDFGTWEQDTELLNLTTWNSQWRYSTTYDLSDNAVDQAGNWWAAGRIITRIDQEIKK